MSVKDFVIPPGQGSVWHMAPGRSATLKITSDIAQSVMMFEEVAPVGTVTDFHIHHASDEIAYVLSGEITFKIGDEVNVAQSPAPSCHAMCRTLGRALALSPPACCSSIHRAVQVSCSRRCCIAPSGQ